MSYSDGSKHGDAETSVYCARKRQNSCGSMHPWFHLVPEPIRTSACPSCKLRLCPERDVRRQQSKRKDYRLFYETLAYVAKTLCQETLCDTITNLKAEPVHLRCSHSDLNVSIHDGFVYVGPSQQQLCFINNTVFLSTLFLMYPLLLQMQLVAWGEGGGWTLHVESMDGGSK